jgi:hypothetical protein
VKTGYRPDPVLRHPALGAIITHELPNPDLEIPRFIALGNNPWPSRGGYLGARYDAFHVSDPLSNRHRSQSNPRRERRIRNLNVLDQTFLQGRQVGVEETLHEEHVRTVLRMMTSQQLTALDFASEPSEVQEAYGDSDFGQACLIARRLIETGVRVVEVTLSGWDTHEDNFTRVGELAARLDGPLSALIADLVQRDLLASTVVLCLGEFGRTPKINPRDGCDHWPTGFSCLVGGGGLRAGQVLGATDPAGVQREPQNPVQISELYATILTTMGIDPAHQVITPIGRPMKYCEGAALARLT